MTAKTREVIKFILKLISNKTMFLFWLFVRLLVSLIPLYTIYLFSRLVNLLITFAPVQQVSNIVLIFAVMFFAENFFKHKANIKLQEIFSNTEFSIHRFLTIGLRTKNKDLRHEAIQSIRNFAEAVRHTLEILRQPGLDSIVSLLITPVILFFIRPLYFWIVIPYIIIYYLFDCYTTRRYTKFKDVQNARVEAYYAKLQDSNNITEEEKKFNHAHNALCKWSFLEWFNLSNISLFFYLTIIILTLISIVKGHRPVSDIVMVRGYLVLIDANLLSLSVVKDRLTDTRVALDRLSRSKKFLSIDLSDLMR